MEWPTVLRRVAYKQLRGGESEDVSNTVHSCWVIWKHKIPLKVKIFGWLLLNQQLMMRIIYWPWVCIVCTGSEDSEHLFFECPRAQAVWASQNIPYANITSGEAFWVAIQCGGPRGAVKQGRMFVALWAIWLHHNEAIFGGGQLWWRESSMTQMPSLTFGLGVCNYTVLQKRRSV